MPGFDDLDAVRVLLPLFFCWIDIEQLGEATASPLKFLLDRSANYRIPTITSPAMRIGTPRIIRTRIRHETGDPNSKQSADNIRFSTELSPEGDSFTEALE